MSAQDLKAEDAEFWREDAEFWRLYAERRNADLDAEMARRRAAERLLGAAPELLDLLKRAAEGLHECGFRDELHAAIAKAGGLTVTCSSPCAMCNLHLRERCARAVSRD